MKIDREKLNKGLKKATFAGVGALTIAAEKAGEIFEALVKKGEAALEEESLEERARKAKEAAETVVARAKDVAEDAVNMVKGAVQEEPAEEAAAEPAAEEEPAEEAAAEPAEEACDACPAEAPEEEKAEA